ncbi:hypothetical protein BAE44_0004356 [Dichanthelium oligosanthes]|uniref:Uncharacterized protein n=1 Tax=Dichanthelium oligosanthes TaxID=888268 RepID=A0A1E5WB81_9POAL|nr:hypothetical protein BAE44_0004356 [Dichanthelium oligosanthes]
MFVESPTSWCIVVQLRCLVMILFFPGLATLRTGLGS